MKEQPKMGVNRTGVQMSPFDTGDMRDDVDSLMPPAPGDMEAMMAVRANYITEADPLGSVPVPGTMKGMISTGASMLTGNAPQLMMDKLSERLSFERTGVRLYEALITKVAALEEEGTATLSGDKLLEIRDDEARHFAMVFNAMKKLGGDPTAQTPCADLVGVESMGLVQVVTDPRTSVVQSLHAILVAEMTDNNGWETLIALAEAQGYDDLAADFRVALASEREHLQQVQAWFDESTVGAPVAHLSDPASGSAAALH